MEIATDSEQDVQGSCHESASRLTHKDDGKETASLYVPDDVDGWRSRVSRRWTEQKNVSTVQRLQTRQDASELSDEYWDFVSEDGKW